MAPGTLRVQVITSFEGICALRAEWQALELACATEFPFQTWEWNTSWWRHLQENRRAVRDLLRVCAVRGASGELVGIAPLMLTERPAFGPLRTRMLQFIGADPNITELRPLLSGAAFESDCYRAVLMHLAANAEQWDWIEWDALPPHVAAAEGIRDLLVGVEEKSVFIIGLPATWLEFKKGLGRNIKESLRHCYNSLKRDGRTYRLEVLTAKDDIVAALPNFFRLHAARANVKDAVRHLDVFGSLLARQFLVDVCEQFAARGMARVFQLWVDDRLVAMRIGFTMGDTLYLYYSGWDPEYGRYSVMTTLLAEVIQSAIADGFMRVNLSTGNDVSKTRWGAREVRYLSARQRSPRRNGRAIEFMYEGAVRARASKVARVLAPGFLVRATHTVGAPTERTRGSDRDGWRDPYRMGAIAAAVATSIAIDLLDGILDGRLNLAESFVSALIVWPGI